MRARLQVVVDGLSEWVGWVGDWASAGNGWETVNPARMQSSWMDILWFYLGDMIFFFSGGGRFGKRCAISQTLL